MRATPLLGARVGPVQGAASVAGLLITTEAMVAEAPRKESGAPMPGGGEMGGMGGGMGGMDF
jgi:chaperonin GroEL